MAEMKEQMRVGSREGVKVDWRVSMKAKMKADRRVG